VIEVHQDTGEIGISLAAVEIRRDPVARFAPDIMAFTSRDISCRVM